MQFSKMKTLPEFKHWARLWEDGIVSVTWPTNTRPVLVLDDARVAREDMSYDLMLADGDPKALLAVLIGSAIAGLAASAVILSPPVAAFRKSREGIEKLRVGDFRPSLGLTIVNIPDGAIGTATPKPEFLAVLAYPDHNWAVAMLETEGGATEPVEITGQTFGPIISRVSSNYRHAYASCLGMIYQAGLANAPTPAPVPA